MDCSSSDQQSPARLSYDPVQRTEKKGKDSNRVAPEPMWALGLSQPPGGNTTIRPLPVPFGQPPDSGSHAVDRRYDDDAHTCTEFEDFSEPPLSGARGDFSEFNAFSEAQLSSGQRSPEELDALAHTSSESPAMSMLKLAHTKLEDEVPKVAEIASDRVGVDPNPEKTVPASRKSDDPRELPDDLKAKSEPQAVDGAIASLLQTASLSTPPTPSLAESGAGSAEGRPSAKQRVRRSSLKMDHPPVLPPNSSPVEGKRRASVSFSGSPIAGVEGEEKASLPPSGPHPSGTLTADGDQSEPPLSGTLTTTSSTEDAVSTNRVAMPQAAATAAGSSQEQMPGSSLATPAAVAADTAQARLPPLQLLPPQLQRRGSLKTDGADTPRKYLGARRVSFSAEVPASPLDGSKPAAAASPNNYEAMPPTPPRDFVSASPPKDLPGTPPKGHDFANGLRPPSSPNANGVSLPSTPPILRPQNSMRRRASEGFVSTTQLASVVQQHEIEPKRRLSVLEMRMSKVGPENTHALEVPHSHFRTKPSTSLLSPDAGRIARRRTSIGSSNGGISVGGTSDGKLLLSPKAHAAAIPFVWATALIVLREGRVAPSSFV
jgi:hypothetical protein